MKERGIDRERAVVAHHQAAEVSEPGVGAFDDPATSVPPQRSAILRRRFLAVGAMRRDQFDSAPCQPLAQRIAVVGLVGDHPHRFLPRTPCTMTPTYADRRERRFREPDFRRGCRVKVLSQRNTDRKSTRLNSSHLGISYAVFCLKKKKINSMRELNSGRVK